MRNVVPLVVLTAFTLTASAWLGAGAAQTIDPQALGPRVGERVPDFSLPDQHGVTRSLKSTFGPNGTILVFFRSADW